MKYEEEDGVLGTVPKFGAIFMSNITTKKECFRRKLLGLPSAQANFVKQVKAGMVLFLFEFERRELYGVFQASSDGAMNIVPHAFSSSGKHFPAQVRFTRIWNCTPLSEHEFQDAIKENYYSKNKFNFGLSEDQVRRLLWLFSSRKFGNKHPPRQFDRQASKPIGKDRRVSGNDSSFLKDSKDKFLAEDVVISAINTKYPGNSSSNFGRLDDDRFLKSDGIENELNVDSGLGYDILTEHPIISLGKRREDRMEYDHDVDHGFGEIICTDNLGDSLCKSGRVAEDSQFLLRDRVETTCIMDSNIGPIGTPEYPGETLANVRSAINGGGFSIRNFVEDKQTPDNGFRSIRSTDHLENTAINARRVNDDHRFFKDCSLENYNLGNGPEPTISADHHVDSLGKLRRTSDDGNFFINDSIEIEHRVDNGIRPILSAEYHHENPLGEVRTATDNGKILMNDTVEIPTEHLLNRPDYVRRANDHNRLLVSIGMENECNVGSVISTVHSGSSLDKRRQADEGMFLKSDKVDNAYNMENCIRSSLSTRQANLSQSMQNPSFYSSKTISGTDYSFSQEQHKPCSPVSRSTEQKNFEYSYPTSHDAIVTRAVPYFPEVPDIHYRHLSSIGFDRTFHHSSVRNQITSTMKQSSPYRLEAKDLSQHLDVASGSVNKVPLPTNPNHYSSPSRTRNSLLGAGCYGNMEAQVTGHEVYEDLLFSESTPDFIPFSRSEIYERQNMCPFIEFDKHATASQGRYEHKISHHVTNQAISVEDASSFRNNLSPWHSGSWHEKSKNNDIKYYQNSEGMCTGSKNGRHSVFNRLTFASDVHVQESGTYMGYDEFDMDASVDQVMNTQHQKLSHKTTKVRKFPLVRQHDMEEMSNTEKQNMIYSQTQCMMENDVRQVIDENCDHIAEETRVVGFKRRSETTRSRNGTKTESSVETVERQTKGSVKKPEGVDLDKQPKRRKLVRPVFGKKGQSDEEGGLSRDGSSNLLLLSHESFSKGGTYQTKESSSKDNTGSCDDAVKSLENENRSSWDDCVVQLKCPDGCGGSNANVEQRSDSGKMNSENCELGSPVFGRKDIFHEGIANNCTSNLQLSSHEGSSAKESTGSRDELARSCENDNMSSQNVGFMHVSNRTICEAGNANADNSDCGVRNAVNGGASLRGDECKDGKRAVPEEDGMGELPT